MATSAGPGFCHGRGDSSRNRTRTRASAGCSRERRSPAEPRIALEPGAVDLAKLRGDWNALAICFALLVPMVSP
jgi:hypothetical protein